MTTHKCLNKHNMCIKWGLEAYKAWMKYQNTIGKCKKGGGDMVKISLKPINNARLWIIFNLNELPTQFQYIKLHLVWYFSLGDLLCCTRPRTWGPKLLEEMDKPHWIWANVARRAFHNDSKWTNMKYFHLEIGSTCCIVIHKRARHIKHSSRGDFVENYKTEWPPLLYKTLNWGYGSANSAMKYIFLAFCM